MPRYCICICICICICVGDIDFGPPLLSTCLKRTLDLGTRYLELGYSRPGTINQVLRTHATASPLEPKSLSLELLRTYLHSFLAPKPVTQLPTNNSDLDSDENLPVVIDPSDIIPFDQIGLEGCSVKPEEDGRGCSSALPRAFFYQATATLWPPRPWPAPRASGSPRASIGTRIPLSP